MYNSRDMNSSAKGGPISFSSTLLDDIYRSIDDGSARSPREIKERDRAAEKWIENKKKKSVGGGGLSVSLPLHLATDTKKLHYAVDKDNSEALFFSSGSNSSDSNSSLFSDHDSIPLPTSKTRSSCFLPPKPKPIRTKTTLAKTEHEDENDTVPKSNSATKSRALKMYAHLKKMNQPISPGMKLTTFINSILHNSKSKRGAAASDDDRSKKPTTTTTTTCSSATSFARSKNLYINQQTTPSCKSKAEMPRTLKLKRHDEMRPYGSSKVQIMKPVDDDDEGRSSSSGSSDCSEDLFEIDHLKLIYTTDGGELPVYETTASKASATSNQSRTFIKGKRN